MVVLMKVHLVHVVCIILCSWYLGGEVSTEAALSILGASDSQHCYGVYRTSDKQYILSTK